jgi:hypothetical protein
MAPFIVEKGKNLVAHPSLPINYNTRQLPPLPVDHILGLSSSIRHGPALYYPAGEGVPQRQVWKNGVLLEATDAAPGALQ